MNSMIKLNSKMLIVDKNLFLTLVMLIAIAMAFAISALPYIAKNSLNILLENQNQIYLNVVQLIVSFLILILAISSFSAWNLGLDRYFLKLAQNQNASIKDVFYYFSIKRAFGAVQFSIGLFALKFSIFIFCQLPNIALMLNLIFQLSTQMSVAVGVIISAGIFATFISGFIFYKLITSSFFLVKYFYISNEYTGFLNALSSSQQIMQNSKPSPFSMQLSFTAWFCCCVFIIPTIYVWSYYRQARAVLANEIMG